MTSPMPSRWTHRERPQWEATRFPSTCRRPPARSIRYGNAFVTRLNATGSGLLYSAPMGGAGSRAPTPSRWTLRERRPWRGGSVHSGFPTTPGAYDTTYNGGGDIFVARLNPTFTGLVYSTYLGGAGSDVAWALALDASGAATVAGCDRLHQLPNHLRRLRSELQRRQPGRLRGAATARALALSADGIPRYADCPGRWLLRAPGGGTGRRAGRSDVRRLRA